MKPHGKVWVGPGGGWGPPVPCPHALLAQSPGLFHAWNLRARGVPATSGPPDLREERGRASGPQNRGASTGRDCVHPGLSEGRAGCAVATWHHLCWKAAGSAAQQLSLSALGVQQGPRCRRAVSVGLEAAFPQWWGAVPATSSLCLSLVPSPAVGASGLEL